MRADANKVVNSFFWRFAERIGAQGVTFVVSIVLARILDPTVYGQIALVTVFTSILQVFVDSGLGTALVQKKEADDLDFSSVFFFNIAVCLILYGLMFVAAPFISDFYRSPELTPVIRVMSIVLIISGIKNVQQAYVSRHMLFKRFFFSTLGGTLGAAAVGIFMAWKGYGVWALVAQYLFNTTVDTIILWCTVKWRPKFMFSIQRLKSMLAFGVRLLGVSIVNTVYNDIRSLIIGKLYTTADLGYYNRAQQFPQVISINIDSSVDSVLLPTMSQRQDDKQAIKNVSRLSIQTCSYVLMPLMIGLAACGETVIDLLLTEKWLPCVPYLRIFCFSFAFLPIFTSNYNAYKALGRSDVYLKVTMWSKFIGIAILLLVMYQGMMWIAYGLLISDFINQYICSRPGRKLYDYGYWDQIKDILPNLIIALIMGLLIYFVQFIGLKDWLTLIIQILAGGLIYLLLSILTKNSSFIYIKDNFLKKYIHI